MDLTLFIVLVVLILVIIYFSNIINNLRKDIRNMNLCSNNEKKEEFIDENKVIIESITNGLNYLKNYL
jgi:hypothetical protein